MRITITTGTGLDRHGQSLSRQAVTVAIGRVTRQLSVMFGGVTVFHGHGAWIDPHDQLIVEKSTTFIVETSKSADPHLAAVFIRNAFNQTSVIVSVSQSEVSFV